MLANCWVSICRTTTAALRPQRHPCTPRARSLAPGTAPGGARQCLGGAERLLRPRAHCCSRTAARCAHVHSPPCGHGAQTQGRQPAQRVQVRHALVRDRMAAGRPLLCMRRRRPRHRQQVQPAWGGGQAHATAAWGRVHRPVRAPGSAQLARPARRAAGQRTAAGCSCRARPLTKRGFCPRCPQDRVGALQRRPLQRPGRGVQARRVHTHAVGTGEDGQGGHQQPALSAHMRLPTRQFSRGRLAHPTAWPLRQPAAGSNHPGSASGTPRLLLLATGPAPARPPARRPPARLPACPCPP